MRTVRGLTILAACAAVLAGCEETNTVSSNPTSTVGPGTRSVSAIDAGILYNRVCAEHAPNFSGTPAELATLPFRQNPETRTYYHTALNMSFKLIETAEYRQCSMVIGARSYKNSDAIIILAAASGNPLEVTVSSPHRISGTTYLRVIGRSEK